MDLIRTYLWQLGTISKDLMQDLIYRMKDMLNKEPNLSRVKGETYIFGDIHGQFFDLIPMFDKIEPLEKVNRVFLGDYVDRGPYGPEVVCYLIALKLKYPKEVVLLRGNHETREMTETFNFRKQCMQYWDDIEVYENIMDMFELFPIACDVNGKYLCMHGGLGCELLSLARINRIDRKREPDREDMLLDLLWADPAKDKDAKDEYFMLNHERACSVYYGQKPVQNLMKREGFNGIV